jgi:hypothetical protein
MSEPSRRRRSRQWIWPAVAVGILLLDALLFRAGLLWKAVPEFGPGLPGENWRMLWAAAATIETQPAKPGNALIVGSSVVIYGVDVAGINARLRQDGVPVELMRFGTHGSTASDSAILVSSAQPLHPWLAIYGVAARDFPKVGSTDTSVVRTFYDSSQELPALQRYGAEQRLAALLKHYWKLYRYRFFVRTALQTAITRRARRIATPNPAHAAPPPPAPPARVPPEALQYFAPLRISPTSWPAWERWRQSRLFSDYVEWMKFAGGMALAAYKTQTVANFGPAGNPQAAAIAWMLQDNRRKGGRVLLLYFPENPVFRGPEAREYFDPALSQAYADFLKREAAAAGARFEDLRDFLEPDEFYDLIHPNLVGQRKLSEHLVQLIEEEWRAHTGLANNGDAERPAESTN